jgi:pyruvate/2-oxoglutarate dehydrogenase complex dihydrolipoamide dehydrogenase (E3) component
MARKDALIKDFADYRRQQLVNGKFKFLRALARFTDPHTLELSTGDKLTSANFVIATGSVVAPPPLPLHTFGLIVMRSFQFIRKFYPVEAGSDSGKAISLIASSGPASPQDGGHKTGI